ncbi:hypothetical protein NQ318_010319 [Aromia moschata]|uniref:Acyltransferase 3 domain-containing protein n=1 Tax=Aromia moschata TaxID=1265417 RepID=A0AAV8X8T8_9CUCU|nr:hypothetical protein NQ318_010319 [Aromia moschata]
MRIQRFQMTGHEDEAAGGNQNIRICRFELLKSSVMDDVKLIWSVCVPDSCYAEDVFPHFNKSITDLTEGLDLAVTLKDEHCVSLADEPQLDTGDYLWVERYFSTLIMGGTVSVDTFFLIGSTLLSYHFFLTVTKTKKFNLFYFYLYRNARIFIPLAVVTAIYATLLNKLGSGPTWYDYSCDFQKPCQDFWWSTLLHLQSYVNPENLCIVQVWYLTDDMLFYYLSPIITIPLWKWPMLGYINFTIIYILSIVSSFWVAWNNKFDGRMPIT